MKTESEIRDCMAMLKIFDIQHPDGNDSLHGRTIRALEWVLGEYPAPPRERPQFAVEANDHIAQPMEPGGFAVRNFPNMRAKKEGE